MSKPAKKAVGKIAPDARHALTAYYKSTIEGIDKKLRLSTTANADLKPVSTGLLASDWVMSGGMYPLFYQLSGMEQSGKSTLSMVAAAQAVRRDVPIVSYWDAEGSVVPSYSQSVLATFNLAGAFSSGRIGYYQSTVLEEFTGYMTALLKSMPDKVFNEDLKGWCYSLSKGLKTTTAMLAALEAGGLKPDRKLSTGNDWYVPTDYDGLEAAIFLDSWPSLIPEKIDEDDEAGGGGGMGLGANARVMAQELPKFAGKLKRKGVCLWSVNQLREKPMVRFGSPEYETGGNALKFSTAVRTRMYSRAVPQGYHRDPNNGGICIEPSVTGEGHDAYAFKAINNVKSKVGRPFLKAMSRVWISDCHGEARGFDPVFDAVHYLQLTGQLSGNVKGYKIDLRLEGNKKPSGGLLQLMKMPIAYADLKRLIVAEHFKDKTLLAETLKKLKMQEPPHLRSWLFAQLRTDKGLWAAGSQIDEAADV